MQSTEVLIKYKKIADTNMKQPGSNSNFQLLQQPTFDGTSVVFFGSNQTNEGIYGSLDGGPLVRISDNKTVIPDLQGPPTSDPDDSPDAYVQSVDGVLSPCADNLDLCRPALVEGDVVFAAANWPAGRAGIHVLGQNTGNVETIVSNSDGQFKGGQFSQPSGIFGMAYFCASGPNLSPGVYAIPYTGGKAIQLLDITKQKTPKNKTVLEMSNSQANFVLMANSLVFYGSNSDGNDGIYRYDPNGMVALLEGGDSIDGFTVPTGGDVMYTEVANTNGLLAFSTTLSGSGGDIYQTIFARQTWTEQKLTMIAQEYQTIPGGGGTYNGTQMGLPPVSDGNRVAFTAFFDPTNGPELVGLFVWNSKTGKTSKVLDGNASIDGLRVMNVNINNASFVRGRLAVTLLLGEPPRQTYGVYVLDLTTY